VADPLCCSKGRGLDSVLGKHPQTNPNLNATAWVEVNPKPRPFQKPKGSATRKFKGLATRLANSSGKLKGILDALCAVVPDAVTAGVGGDMGLGITFGVEGGIVANGASGEVSLFSTGTTSIGFIGPDAYAALGVARNAPTNSSLNSHGQPSKGIAVGLSRTGVQASKDSFQGTYGVSMLPVTVAYQASLTNVSGSVPFLGYLLNPPRAICRAVTGK